MTGRRLVVMFIPVLVGYLVAPLSPAGNQPATLLAGLTILIVLGAATWTLPWSRLPPRAHLVPALGLLAVVAILRHGAGGAESGYLALLLIPVLWLALHATHAELYLGLLGMAVALTAPMVLFGSADYPVTERLIVWGVVAPFTGVVVQRLVHGRSQALAELEQLSRVDPLTGVANRRAWDEALGAALLRARPLRAPLAVAMIDIDHFKKYNDAHGHPAGDRLLRAATAAWRAQLQRSDVLARHGGEEFAILLEGRTPREAAAVVEGLRRAMPDGQTCSAGLAIHHAGESADLLLARADAALYDAKARGRDCTVAPLPAPSQGMRLVSPVA